MRRWVLIGIGILLSISLMGALAHSWPNPHLRWKRQCKTSGATGMTIGRDGKLYLIDYTLRSVSNGGKILWSVEPSNGERVSDRGISPVLDEAGNVYVASESGLFAYNPTGVQQWEQVITSNLGPRLALTKELVLVNDDDKLLAFSHEGKLKWTYTHGYMSLLGPATDQEGNAYISYIEIVTPATATCSAAFNYWLVRVSPKGKPEWKKSLPAYVNEQVVLDGRLYIGSNDGLLCFGLDGTLKWYALKGIQVWGGPAFDKAGNMYCTGPGSSGIAVDAVSPNGSVLWSCNYPLPNIFMSAARGRPAVVGSTLYVGASYNHAPRISPLYGLIRMFQGPGSTTSMPKVRIPGRMLAIDTRSGKLQWDYMANENLECELVVGSDGTVYAAGWEGNLYAFKP